MKEDSSTSTASVSLSRETRAIEEDFIETYKNIPLLWDTDHKYYTNKYKRNEALDVLLKIIKRWDPAATRTHVRQKINILRSTYRKDMKKYSDGKLLGLKDEEIFLYEPKNWKFYALSFLDKNWKNIKKLPEISEIYMDENNFDEEGSGESASENGEPLSDTSDVLASMSEDEPPRKRNQTEIRKKLVKDKLDDSYGQNNNLLNREMEAIGANVICKLKRMDPLQRYHAELLINKVLIKGLKNNLSEETDLTDH